MKWDTCPFLIWLISEKPNECWKAKRLSRFRTRKHGDLRPEKSRRKLKFTVQNFRNSFFFAPTFTIFTIFSQLCPTRNFFISLKLPRKYQNDASTPAFSFSKNLAQIECPNFPNFAPKSQFEAKKDGKKTPCVGKKKDFFDGIWRLGLDDEPLGTDFNHQNSSSN